VTHPSELISAYLDGELIEDESSELLSHLATCGRCSANLVEMQSVRAAVRSLPILELPAGLLPESDAAVVPIHRNRGVWVGAAAAAVALIIAIASIVTPPPPSISADDLSSRFGARASLDPAFSPAKVVLPVMGNLSE
jgi:anti-sigma factor RsiW